MRTISADMNLVVCWCLQPFWPCWRHESSLSFHFAFQHLALGSFLREHNYSWASSSAGEGIHPFPFATASPRRWGQTGPGRGSPLRTNSYSLLLLYQDVSKSWSYLHYRARWWEMGNFSSAPYTSFSTWVRLVTGGWWGRLGTICCVLPCCHPLLQTPAPDCSVRAPAHSQNSGYTLHVNLWANFALLALFVLWLRAAAHRQNYPCIFRQWRWGGQSSGQAGSWDFNISTCTELRILPRNTRNCILHGSTTLLITGVQTLRASSGKQMVIAERKTSYIKKKKKKKSAIRRQVATVNTGDLSKGQELTQCS